MIRFKYLFSFLQWRQRVNRSTVRADLLAGLAGAIVVLPQGVAFGTLAGMPPEYGLYAAMVPAVVVALFGSSWHLVSGPSTTGSLIVFATLSAIAVPETAEYVRLALTLAFLVGIFQLLLALLRLGVLIDFVSQTVIAAYVTGAAAWIFSSQIGNFFGLDIPRGTSFVAVYDSFTQNFAAINGYATAVGVVTLLACLLTRRFLPRVPYMIVGMLAGTFSALILNAISGPAETDIATVAAISTALPPLSSPVLSWDAIQPLLLGALVITLLSSTEAITIARSIALRTDQVIHNNKTIIAQGLGNLVGSFFSAYPTSGSFNRSAVNYAAGARTPLSAIFSSVFLVVILLLVSPLAQYVPIASMAAILVVVAFGLVNVAQIRTLLRSGRLEALVLVSTFAATLVDLRFSLFLGVAASLIIFVYHASRPAVTTALPSPAPGAVHFIDGDGLVPECPTLKIVRIDGALYFGAANYVQQALLQIDRDNPAHRHVLIIARGLHYLDAAGAQVLAQEARRRRAFGGGLYFYRMKDTAHAVLRKSGYIADIGEENIYATQPGVVDSLVARIKTKALPEPAT